MNIQFALDDNCSTYFEQETPLPLDDLVQWEVEQQQFLLKRMDEVDAWMSFLTGFLPPERAWTHEEVAARALRYKLQKPHIVAENVRLSYKVIDRNGISFVKGFETEVDIVTGNDVNGDNELIVFEVKATRRVSDVSMFALKVNLVRSQNPYKQVHGLLIAPAASAEVQDECAKCNLQLLK